MKRSLLLLGSVLSIASAVGLLAFGAAFVTIMDGVLTYMDGVLTYRFVDPPEPLPASFADVKWAAFSGVALALGLAIACIGMVMDDNRKTISLAGRISASVASIGRKMS